MIVAGFVLVALVLVFLRRRSAAKDVRAGLVGDRPVFSVEPASRRLGSRKGERL